MRPSTFIKLFQFHPFSLLFLPFYVIIGVTKSVLIMNCLGGINMYFTKSIGLRRKLHDPNITEEDRILTQLELKHSDLRAFYAVFVFLGFAIAVTLTLIFGP